MNHDYSLESQITNGKVQYIKEIKTDLNTLQITFCDLNHAATTCLELIGFYRLFFKLDFPDNLIDYNERTVQSLIGFSFDKAEDKYVYCLKADDYEVTFESGNFPVIRQVQMQD